jgi:hypothetical protein
MSSQISPHRPLPCQAEHQKIIEQAKFVLAEAQTIAKRCGQTLTLLSADIFSPSWSAMERCQLLLPSSSKPLPRPKRWSV